MTAHLGTPARGSARQQRTPRGARERLGQLVDPLRVGRDLRRGDAERILESVVPEARL
ncbi:hypothetical protein [Promicromonospora sp. NPDC090134]|uniref:hypothetical protein n=1 Tax=Promicromonospora sp. NPDC090134 TaxID=3364408 RepID=UPI00380EA03D